MISEQYFHLFFISSGFILQKIEQNVYQFKMFVIQRLYLISFATTSTRNYCVKTLVKLPICVSGYIHLWYHIYLFFRSNSIHYLIWYILDTTIKKRFYFFVLFVCLFFGFFLHYWIVYIWQTCKWNHTIDVAQALCGTSLLEIASVRKYFVPDLFSKT